MSSNQKELRTPEFHVPFPIQEYKNRLSKVKKEMSDNGIDLLYVTLPESMYYLTGYQCGWYRVNSAKAWLPMQVFGVAISLGKDECFLFEIPGEEDLLLSNTVNTKYRVYGGSAAKGQHNSDLIVEDLHSDSWFKKGNTVGLEMSGYRPVYTNFVKLQSVFEKFGCSVVDGTAIVNQVRRIKSPMELQQIERATKICDIGHKAIADNLRPGMTELEVVGVYTNAMCKAGGEPMGIVNLCRSGHEAVHSLHVPASRRVIIPGEPVAADICGVYNRYHSNQSRFYSLGKPQRELADFYKWNRIVMEQVRDLIKPNMYVRDLNNHLKDFYQKEGIWGKGLWLGGYELGIAFPPDWVGYYMYDPSIDAGDERFEPGMVVNFETAFGVIDTLMFTENEARVLGETTWDLIVVD